MGRRTLLLIMSVLLAATGTALVALYVRQTDQRAARSQATADYVVAARTITRGDTIGPDDLTVRAMRAADQLPSAVTDPQTVIGRQATSDVLSGVTIDTRILTRPGATAQAPIRSGELGVDVLLQDPNRAVSLLGTGSWVRILAESDDPDQADILVRQARVISIGATLEAGAAPGPDGSNAVGSAGVPESVVGLSVPQDVARRITAAQMRQVPLYFTVIPTVDVTEDS